MLSTSLDGWQDHLFYIIVANKLRQTYGMEKVLYTCVNSFYFTVWTVIDAEEDIVYTIIMIYIMFLQLISFHITGEELCELYDMCNKVSVVSCFF